VADQVGNRLHNRQLSPVRNRRLNPRDSQRGNQRGNRHLSQLGNRRDSPRLSQRGSHLHSPHGNRPRDRRRCRLGILRDNRRASRRPSRLEFLPTAHLDNRRVSLLVGPARHRTPGPVHNRRLHHQDCLHRFPRAIRRLGRPPYRVLARLDSLHRHRRLNLLVNRQANRQGNHHHILLFSHRDSPRVDPVLIPAGSRHRSPRHCRP
jgi:hypothetical protein